MTVSGEIYPAPQDGTDDAAELLSAQKEQKKRNTLNLLIFSVAGVFFGIDADQVAEISAYQGEKGEDLFWFHEEMGYGEKAVRYSSPAIATIRNGGVAPYRVIIDSMEDIAEFKHKDIRLFPTLLEPYLLRRGIWGILPRNGNMILLLDFKRLYLERGGGNILI
ncbi:MAG: hypothetical protein PHD54_07430 [Desulfuromonadaceae bacterium]|nr:hypothetical protein [Desulfuromonadaceae bacterium]